MGKVEMDKEQLRKVCECEEVNRLKNMEIVIGRLKSENDRLVKEIVGVNKEMIGLEKTIDGLNREIEHLLSEKNEMEIVQIGEIEELERKSDKFNETVQNLTKEDKESELERLMEEKKKQMEMVNEQSSDKDKLIELQEGISSREANLVELNQKAVELTHALAKLQKDYDDQTKINDKFICKVGQLSYALAQVEKKLKREEADKTLDEEKRHVEHLKAEVLKSGKRLAKTLEDFEKVKIARESLFSSEKAALEKAMAALKTELESAGMDAERNLGMLKNAASMLSQPENREDRLISEQQNREKGTESYAVELESIEKAFRNKEGIFEKMKKEAEIMKQSTHLWFHISRFLLLHVFSMPSNNHYHDMSFISII
ncbi:unnamed protein product [Arabidopsis lyrata]|nr:unnamed protein product [Arabidopsis lyrata]